MRSATVDRPPTRVVLYKRVNNQSKAEWIILERTRTTLVYAAYAINIRIILF